MRGLQTINLRFSPGRAATGLATAGSLYLGMADRGESDETIITPMNPLVAEHETAEETLQRLEDSVIEKKKTLARAFILDSNNEWVTVATGVAVSDLAEDGTSLNVSLVDEAAANLPVGEHGDTPVVSTRTLFSASFHRDQEIIRQQATVVTWTATDGTDIALSFENEEGCDIFWIDICKFLGRPLEYTAVIPADEQSPGIGSSTASADGEADMSMTEGSSRPSLAISLPEEVEFSTLSEIDLALDSVALASLEVKREVCLSLLERSYVGRLLHLFRIAEDLDSRETLFRLYNIFKHLVLLNHPSILRELMSDTNVIQVAGVFEYDPQYPEGRPGYRQFLLDRQRFKQILPFRNSHLVELIHQTFRAQYLKDVVLPRILDEETFGSLLFLIRCNFAEIIELLEADEEFLPKLLPLFKDDGEEVSLQVLKFMKEFLSIAKTSANGRNLRLYQDEYSFHQFLKFLQRFLAGDSTAGRSLAIEVLMSVTQHDANIIRTFMIDSRGEPVQDQLLTLMIDRIIDETADFGVRWQLVAILRTLLDTAASLGLVLPSDEFLNFFYPDHALRLLSPLVKLERVTNEQQLSAGLTDVYYNCCELLCSFIIQHKYRMKYLLFRSFIVHNALHLLRVRPRVLRMAAVRLVRTMLGTGDDFYFRFLIKQGLLKPIVEAAGALGTTNNALSSALLEFFSYMRERKYRLIIAHLVETCRGELEQIQMAPIATDLRATLEELTNPRSSGGGMSSDLSTEHQTNASRDPWSMVDRTEEAYFSSIDDDSEEGDGGEGAIHGKGGDEDTGKPSDLVDMMPIPRADEVPEQVVTTWLPENDLERNKRMKY